MKRDQSRAPILDGMLRYNEAAVLPFTTPGHKRGEGVADEVKHKIGAATFRNDLAMQNAVDDRRESKDVLGEAEQLAAEAFGAEQSTYSTNGSSLSAHTAVLTVAETGEEVLVVRNTHRSMISALLMADVRPTFLHPEIDDELDVEHGVMPEYVREMLAIRPNAKAVFIVSPTYYGVVSDVKAIAEACHERDIPLIVDEAWGPHFPFHPELPDSAMSCGADISFGSIHKTMNGLGQAAVIHRQGKLIDADRFTLCFDLFETTSQSSLILGSCDGARRQMALHGRELWGRALELSRTARAHLAGLQGLRVVGTEVIGRRGVFALDETKLVVDVRGLGISGYMAADWIFENHNVTFELITHRHLMALITIADTQETVDRMVAALRDLHRWAQQNKPDEIAPLPHSREIGTQLVMPPSRAFFGPTKKVKLEKAAGEIAAEQVSPYPPGIPRLVPGERITQPIVDYLQRGRDAGMFVLDPSDTTLKTLRVVADKTQT
jgi:arginine/lysine/ornithine decarboxylase